MITINFQLSEGSYDKDFVEVTETVISVIDANKSVTITSKTISSEILKHGGIHIKTKTELEENNLCKICHLTIIQRI